MLYKELERRGATLFRWRSFLPFLMIPLALYFAGKAGVGNKADDHYEHLWLYVCAAISVVGLTLRALIVGYTPRNTSGRNTRRQKADTLNTTGMYSIVRHPLYFANFWVFSGFVLMFASVEFYAIAALIYYLYYLQIMMAEERFLYERFGEPYEEWASRTNAFWPNPRRWVRPALPFSWKNVLRREAATALLVSTVFFCFEFIEDVLIESESVLAWLRHDVEWAAQFVLVGAAYCVIRYLKNYTNTLRVDDR